MTNTEPGASLAVQSIRVLPEVFDCEEKRKVTMLVHLEQQCVSTDLHERSISFQCFLSRTYSTCILQTGHFVTVALVQIGFQDEIIVELDLFSNNHWIPLNGQNDVRRLH